MRKRHSPNFKAETVIEVLKEDQTVNQIASAKEIHPTQIYDWKAHALQELHTLFEPQGKRDAELRAAYEKRIHELYAEIGKLTTQLEWLRQSKALHKIWHRSSPGMSAWRSSNTRPRNFR